MPIDSSSHLTLRAGAVALAQLREHGFSADAFSTLVGASGGPKWLVLSQLDRVLVEHVLAPRKQPLEMLGSSIGSFRHACFAQSDPLAAIARFEQAYVAQAYDGTPQIAEVTRQSRTVVDAVLGERGAREIERNRSLRCHVIAARLRGARRADGAAFKWLLGGAAALNAAARRGLGLVFERAVFSSVHGRAPRFDDFTTHAVPLCEGNAAAAILAGGSIPLIMEPVLDIPYAPTGLYLDGGILDYHFDFRFRSAPGLVLYPHFFDRIVPGWFDKALPWRAPSPVALDRVVMIGPSRRFIASLPGAKVPDRDDFVSLSTEARQQRWREIIGRCRALADELHALLAKGRFVDALQPF